jgi:hypothetical protein
MKNRKSIFGFFPYNGLNFKLKPLDLGVAVRTALAIALRSLPLAGVAIGKFNRGRLEQRTRWILLLSFACFDLISLWDLPG